MNRRRSAATCALAFIFAGAFAAWALGCGTDVPQQTNYGTLVNAAFYNPGTGAGGSGYGSGGNNTDGGGPSSEDAALPPCPVADRACPAQFVSRTAASKPSRFTATSAPPVGRASP